MNLNIKRKFLYLSNTYMPYIIVCACGITTDTRSKRMKHIKSKIHKDYLRDLEFCNEIYNWNAKNNTYHEIKN